MLVELESGSILLTGVPSDILQGATKIDAGRLAGVIATNGTHYWSVDHYSSFTPLEQETPQVFKKLTACESRCKRLNSEPFWSVPWAPAIWIHYEVDIAGLDKYKLMTGCRFPGSPKR